jgi:hypothetical protein
MEDQAPSRGDRVDVLPEDHQADAALVQLIGEHDEGASLTARCSAGTLGRTLP